MGLASATTELCAPTWEGGTSAAHLAVWSILSVCMISYISIFYFRGLCSIPCVVPAQPPCLPAPLVPLAHHHCLPSTSPWASSCQQSRAGGSARQPPPPFQQSSPQRATHQDLSCAGTLQGWGAAGKCPFGWWHLPCCAHSSACTSLD